MLKEIKGDITKIECDYICQQCNCIAVRPHGLSKTIADKLKVCPYSRREADGNKNLAIPSDRPPLGSLLTEKSPIKDVSVICMFAQYSYGTPGQYYYSRNETFADRELYFQKCLDIINRRIKKKKIKEDAVIAFPKRIGCGLAKGNWNNYYKMIENFSIGKNVLLVDYN